MAEIIRNPTGCPYNKEAAKLALPQCNGKCAACSYTGLDGHYVVEMGGQHQYRRPPEDDMLKQIAAVPTTLLDKIS